MGIIRCTVSDTNRESEATGTFEATEKFGMMMLEQLE
jgi:hypothetical protein